MAEKRMFAKTIIDSDAFLEMPVTSQLLYFHLSMRADDEGFINKPKAIMKMIGANDDDLKILFMKKFVIPFESGVVVIKHWRINNYIRKDMFHETTYKDERAMLEIDENNAYRLPVTNMLQNRNELTTQISIDKNSIDKNSIDNYCTELSEDISMQVPIFQIPLNKKGTYHYVTQEEIDMYEQLYPNVNIIQEYRKMIGWCLANPTKLKTKNGIQRFINTWLSKEQDKGGNSKEEREAKIRSQNAYADDVELRKKQQEIKEQGGNWFE